MTVPRVRKRQKHEKRKSGCRTCKERRVKCDEARPVCKRCLNSGKCCAGYDAPPSRTTHLALLPKTALAAVAPKPAPYGGLSPLPCALTAAGRLSLDYFRTHAIKGLAGSDWRLAWDRLLLPLCLTEPVVVHAAVALGSLHRAVTSPYGQFDDLRGEDRLQLAETQYIKAIANVRRYIEDAGERMTISTAEVLLIVTLILLNFDVLASQDARAALHLHNGLRVLYEQARDPQFHSPDPELRVVPYRVDPRTRMDLLTHTFVRLEADMSLLNDEEVYLSPVIDQPLPSSFLSVDQAQVHLDVLENQVYNIWCDLYDIAECDLERTRPGFELLDEDMQDVLVMAAMRTTSLESHPELVQRLATMKQSLVRWTNALSFVPVTSPDDCFRMHVEIHFWYLWVTIAVMRDADELPVDNFEDQFKHFLGKIECFCSQHLVSPPAKMSTHPMSPGKTRPGMTVGTCVGLTLCLIIELCRTSWIRRRGIALVRSMDMRGLYDSDFLASYYEAIINIEEDAARLLSGKPDQFDFESHEIPAEARILECDISNILCTRKDYYHADTGRMLYVTHGQNGALEIFDRTFVVTRPEIITPVDSIFGG